MTVDSDNPSGADNQQETATPRLELDAGWVVGFVDGEGCFSVSIHHNPRFAKRTWDGRSTRFSTCTNTGCIERCSKDW